MNKTITLKTLFILMTIGSMSACSTIYFHNGERSPQGETHSEYHHMAGLDLVEVSKPIDLRQRCGDQEWQTVKTQRTFLNGLATAFTLPFYSP